MDGLSLMLNRYHAVLGSLDVAEVSLTTFIRVFSTIFSRLAAAVSKSNTINQIKCSCGVTIDENTSVSFIQNARN